MNERELNERRATVGVWLALAIAGVAFGLPVWLLCRPNPAPSALTPLGSRPDFMDKPHRHSAADAPKPSVSK